MQVPCQHCGCQITKRKWHYLNSKTKRFTCSDCCKFYAKFGDRRKREAGYLYSLTLQGPLKVGLDFKTKIAMYRLGRLESKISKSEYSEIEKHIKRGCTFMAYLRIA